MTGICKRPDCTGTSKSRGMCNRHYMEWYGGLSIKPVRQRSSDLVLSEMPGTTVEIATRAGLSYGNARIAIMRLYAAGSAHIFDVNPPLSQGSRWINVFAAGPGEDATVTRRQKNEYTQRGRRIQHHALRAVRIPDPLVLALFGSRSIPQGGQP